MLREPDNRSTCIKVGQLIRSVQDVSGMDAYANFAFGLRTGIMMMQELNNLDEIQEPFSG